MIDNKQMHRLIDIAKTQFTDQPSHIYWNDTTNLELTHVEKLVLAYIQGINAVTDFNIKVDCK